MDAQALLDRGFDQDLIELSEIERDVLGRITKDAWLSLAAELITTGQPDACNPLDPDMPSGSEEKIANRVAGYLRSIGFETELVAAEPGRPNVVGRRVGAPEGPTLAFNTHLDTYPALEADRWTMTGGNPFNPTRHGDWLYARGASDTRGNMAASLIAARALAESGVRLGGALMCVYTVNEEKNGPFGSLFLTREKGFKPDAVIVAEPTAWGLDAADWGMSISVANSGHCLIELIIEGVKSHLWRPDVALNPIDKMASVIGKLSGPTLSYDTSQLAGHTPPSLTCLRLEAGIPGEMQFTPGRCRAVLAGVGLVPGMTMEGILADIRDILDAELAGTGFTAALRQYPGSLFVSGSQAVDPGEQPCLSIRKSYRRLLGKEPPINRKNAFNDTIRFREAGIAAVTFGPGEDSWAPDNEAISISKAVIAAKLYALIAMDFLGVGEAR